MDWKSALGNAARTAHQKGQEWGAQFQDERARASNMSDDQLLREIKSGYGSQTRRSALVAEANSRGIKVFR